MIGKLKDWCEIRVLQITASAFCLLALAIPAQAQDIDVAKPKEVLSPTYSPNYCEFTVTFPESPYKVRRCEKEAGNQCYDLVSYTQVYDMSSTVNFRVICNEITKDVYDSYSPEVMEATLRAMTKSSVVKEFNSSFREEKEYKQAGLVGEGLVGRTPTIYLAQLWIGQHSALSVEAELIGEPNEEADKLFSDVLRSIILKAAPKDDAADDALESVEAVPDKTSAQ